MRRDVTLAIAISAVLHVGVALGGYFYKGHSAPAAPEPEDTTLEVFIAPPPEPEEPDLLEYTTGEAAGGPADVAAPMLADTPTATIDSPFVQTVQPPPPPGLTVSADAITIPVFTGTGGGTGVSGHGLGHLFDLADLDQNPVLVSQVRPIYPYEMSRAGVSGEVTVSLVVDSEGRVRNAVATRSTHRAFEAAAVQAVLKWRFRPGTKSGRPVNTRMTQLIVFNLRDS